jgi:gas vesicle protein
MEDSRLSAFLLGLGIGTAVGILFAPKAGEETREELRARALEGRDYVKRRSHEIRHQAEEVIEKGREKVQSQRDQLSAALDAGRRAYREANEAGAPAAGDSPAS